MKKYYVIIALTILAGFMLDYDVDDTEPTQMTSSTRTDYGVQQWGDRPYCEWELKVLEETDTEIYYEVIMPPCDV